MRPVGHFAYVPECRWLVGSVLTTIAGCRLCDDPAGVDRSLVHRQATQDVVAFLVATLAGPRSVGSQHDLIGFVPQPGRRRDQAPPTRQSRVNRDTALNRPG